MPYPASPPLAALRFLLLNMRIESSLVDQVQKHIYFKDSRSFVDRLMADDPPPPSLLWRSGSTAVMGLVGTLTRVFTHGPNWQDVHGLDGFLELLDKRADVDGRQRGLITGMRQRVVYKAMMLTNASQYPTTSACTYVSPNPDTIPSLH